MPRNVILHPTFENIGQILFILTKLLKQPSLCWPPIETIILLCALSEVKDNNNSIFLVAKWIYLVKVKIETVYRTQKR